MEPDARTRKMLDAIRAEIRPTADERRLLARVEATVLGRLARVLPSDVEVGLVGSVSKGTALRHNRDLDLFLLFPASYPEDRMAERGLAWAKAAMRGCKTEVSYAQHPYLKAYVEGVKVDIVPSFKIDNIAARRSAVDRSQLHLLWANPRLDEAKRDDVRLLKQFCKCLGVYGAQTRVEGFSGYLCELLIIHHGSFLALLEAASKWKQPMIDPAHHHAAERSHSLFPEAAMVVIDPVDAGRNVSAVVSRTSLYRFVLAARAFLSRPSRDSFFKEREVHSVSKLRAMIESRGTCTLLLTMPSPKLVEDVLWPQLRKTAQSLLATLERDEFRPFGHYFFSDGKTSLVLFELMEERLPSIRRQAGPQVWHAADVERFLLSHKSAANLHVEHERVLALARRVARTPKESLLRALKDPSHLGIPAPFLKALRARRWGTAFDLLKDPIWREVAADYFSRKL